MKTDVESFIDDAKLWRDEMAALREILLRAKLDEALKWKLPCYGFEGRNIAIIQPFKARVALMFFKGVLLDDPKGLLVEVGPNSRSGKRCEFASVREVEKAGPALRAFVKQAIALEVAGEKVRIEKTPEALPAELEVMLAKKPAFKKAFFLLTPGRQRAYVLHFSSAKQAATRQARIERCMPSILEGKGMTDR